jgi:hypothetical protein
MVIVPTTGSCSTEVTIKEVIYYTLKRIYPKGDLTETL